MNGYIEICRSRERGAEVTKLCSRASRQILLNTYEDWDELSIQQPASRATS